MGGEPYWYIVKYQGDVNESLQALREREFQAGRYNPVTPFLWEMFPIGPDSPTPGCQHTSIEEVLEEAEEDGTRSILDLDHVSDTPDYCAVAPVAPEVLEEVYGTTEPTREMVEANMNFMESIERGQGAYIIIYKDGAPDEILFAGYSFD